MVLKQDGVTVFCPIGYCAKDKGKRKIGDITECPDGDPECDGNCFYYKED